MIVYKYERTNYLTVYQIFYISMNAQLIKRFIEYFSLLCCSEIMIFEIISLLPESECFKVNT